MEKMVPKENWPMLLDMTKDECKRSLRSLELSAYSQVISVFRAQGELTKEKRKILTDLQTVFLISLERHRAEIRRAVNDETLNTIAETLAGPNTGVEWAIEGRRLIPLMPRVAPQVAYTALATQMAQRYYGINRKLPPPSSTAKYGKFDDLGAESEETDSEEETEGLRFIQGSMVPPQFNMDHGTFTSLPQSQARLFRQQLKEMKEAQEALQATASAVVSSTNSTTPVSPPTLASPTTQTSNSNTTVTTASCNSAVMTTVSSSAASNTSSSDKRKRKRSISTEHGPISQPTPTTICQQFPVGQSTPTKQVATTPRPISGASMKITVAGSAARPLASPVSTLSTHTQKVILVSTSGTSGGGGGMYQRSVSVPMMKSSNTITSTVASGHTTVPHPHSTGHTTVPHPHSTGHTPVPHPHSAGHTVGPHSHTATVRSGPVVPSTTAITNAPVYSGAYVSRMRPRLPSVGGVPRAARQRSNSLVLHTETSAASTIRGRDNIQVSGSSIPAQSSTNYPNSPAGIVALSANSHNPAQLITHQAFQVCPSAPTTAKPAAIHIRQEGGAKIITHGMGSHVGNVAPGPVTNSPSAANRVVGRAPIPPCASSSTQGLYVVSSNSGSTITVVTRTVAAGQGLRTATPTSVMSLGSKTVQTVRVTPHGQAGALRPMMGVSKSNVIVVHKGGTTPGVRPVGFQAVKDGSTKITIGKTAIAAGGGPSGNVNANIQSNVVTGTLLGKPTTITRAFSSITGGSTVQPINNISNTGPPPNNMIVVEMSQEAASTTTTSTNTSNSALADILQATGILSGGSVGHSPMEGTNTTQASTQHLTVVSSVQTGGNVPLVQSTTVNKAVQSAGIANTAAKINANNASNICTVTTSTATAPSIASTVPSGVSTMVLSSAVPAVVTTTTSASVPISTSPTVPQLGVSLTNTSVTQTQPSLSSPEGTGDEWMGIGLDEDLEEEETESQEEESANQNMAHGQMQVFEEAAENLGRGDRERAQNILQQAGIELVDSPNDGDSTSESMTVGSMMDNNAVTESSAEVGGHHHELDPATGLFYNPSATESSSESSLSTSVESSRQMQQTSQDQEDSDTGKEN